MTISEYINEKNKLMYEIQSSEAKIKLLRDKAVSCQAPLRADAGLNPTKNIHKTEDIIIDKITLEENVRAATEKLDILNNRFRESLKLLDKPEYRTAVELRTLMGIPWNKVASSMGYCTRQVQRFHEKAELQLEKMSHHVAPCTIDFVSSI